jgi:O-antigen/teichoic acid export membrane protein
MQTPVFRRSYKLIMSAPMLSRANQWLHSRSAYTTLAPILTIAGAATTVAAPMLLQPAAFGSYILLLSIFQYTADFDLGLSRLADRTLSQQVSTENLTAFFIARIYVAITMAVVLATIAAFTGWLTAVVGLTGIAFMLSNGPVAVYRATSNVRAFTLSALLLQLGLSLPRFLGLLTGGVTGCVLALAAWYLMTAVVVNAPFVERLRGDRRINVRSIFAKSLPLCVFGSLWLLYLLIGRWFSWLQSSATDAGLYAFGANLLSVGVGVISTIAQAYYPRHLSGVKDSRLFRELLCIIIIVGGGALLGNLVCRYALTLIFPHFAAAGAATAIILFTGIPLCGCAWIIFLVIAKSIRPWRESVVMFGVSILLLYGFMRLFGAYAGIEGQALAFIPSASALFGMQLQLLVRRGLLSHVETTYVWLATATAFALSGGVWYVLFHGVT